MTSRMILEGFVSQAAAELWEQVAVQRFLMEMREVRLVRMEERLHTLINGAEDSVVIARLDDAKTSESIVFIGSRNYEDVRVPTVI